MKLVEVKYFEPAEGESDDLEGYLSHPDRYRYTNCWLKVEDGIKHCSVVGGQAYFPFPDNFCPKFLGYFPAIILREIDADRARESDRFAPYQP